MKPDDVKQIVGDTPHMTLEQDRQIGDFRTIENWAFAHKVGDSMINPRQIHREYVYPPPSVKNFFRAVNQAAARRMRRWVLKQPDS